MKLYILKIPKELEREEYIRLYENIDETKQRKIMNFRMSEDRIRGLLADNLVPVHEPPQQPSASRPSKICSVFSSFNHVI